VVRWEKNIDEQNKRKRLVVVGPTTGGGKDAHGPSAWQPSSNATCGVLPLRHTCWRIVLMEKGIVTHTYGLLGIYNSLSHQEGSPSLSVNFASFLKMLKAVSRG
jgi:hypothetical protein